MRPFKLVGARTIRSLMMMERTIIASMPPGHQPRPKSKLTAAMTTILKNGALRGEIQPEETHRIISLPLDLLRRELIMRREPISDKTIEEIADDIFLPFIHAQP